MHVLRVLSLLAAMSIAPLAAQSAPPADPSPLTFNPQFLLDASPPDIEALAAAIRLEVLADPKRAQTDAAINTLARATDLALKTNRNNLSWVIGSRLLAMLRGEKMSLALDEAISLRFALDRRVVVPGGLLHARIERLFRIPQTDEKVRIRFAVADSAGKVVWQGEPMPVLPENPIEVALPVRSLAEGEYNAIYSFHPDGGKPLVTGTRTFRIDGSWRKREAALAQALRALALKGFDGMEQKGRAAVQFVEWSIQAMQGYASGEAVAGAADPHPVIESWAYERLPRFWSGGFSPADVKQAEAFVKALETGADPFAGSQDMRLAFRSTADQTLRTYRLYLPSSLPADVPVPMAVLLHGFAGDESSWLDRLPEAGEKLRRLAADKGFAILCPAARSHYSRFEGPDAADLVQLKDFVMRIRPIDPKRVALIGHGPSAFTAVNAALADAAIWPVAVAVAGLPTGMPVVKEGSRPRLLFEHAAADKLFSPAEARNWAFLLQKRIPGFQSRELPGADNPQAPAAGIEQAIEFFLSGSAAIPPAPEVPKK